MASAVLIGGAGVIRVVQAGPDLVPVVLLSLGVLLAAVFAYLVYRQNPGRLPDGAWWAGTASVSVADLHGSGHGAGLRLHGRRRIAVVTAGRGLIALRMTLRAEGILFECRLQAALAGVRGRVLVPWEAVASVPVGDVGLALNRGLGGAFTVHLASGARIAGEFLGPRPRLVEALRRAPIAHR